MRLELLPFEHPEWIYSGKLFTVEMEMVPYPDRRRRTIRIWLPESYDGVRRYPVVYFHDGQYVFTNPEQPNVLRADETITRLADEGIEAIIVGVDTGDRRLEELTPPGPRSVLPFNPLFPAQKPSAGESTTDTYMTFIADTLKPLIDSEFMTLPDPSNTCIAGVSAGGSCSLYMAMYRPEVFGRAIAFSPGLPRFTLEGLMDIVDNYDISRLKESRIVFYNGDQGLDATSLLYVVQVYRRFKERGLDRTQLMMLTDSREAHLYAAWGKYFPEFMRFLFEKDNTKAI